MREKPYSANAPDAPPGDLLSLKAIADALGVGYERLRGFGDAEGMKELLGARRMKGSRGVGWPAASVENFRRALELQDEGVITPKTAAGYLKSARSNQNGQSAQSGQSLSLTSPANNSGIVPLAQSDNLTTAAVTKEEVLEAIAEGVRRSLPPPSNPLLTLKDAQGQYGVSLAALRKLAVKEGGRWKVKRSIVIAYIQMLD